MLLNISLLCSYLMLTRIAYVSYAHLGCIYLVENAAKTVI